jgi:hypothetical protein
MMAIMLIVLIESVAMAVDLGWLCRQSLEIQHGADAAALAGVIYEPDLRTEAKTAADETAVQNGSDDSNPGTTVTVVDFVDDDTSGVRESMLRVTITHQINTFHLKIFGINDFGGHASVQAGRSLSYQATRPVRRVQRAARTHESHANRGHRYGEPTRRTCPKHHTEPIWAASIGG